ncbi:MAG: GIY-YIG nuclease family protein [Patescibacteria group bacterium]
MYYLYILECKDGSLYTGITTDVKRRFREHLAGKGGHYTRSHTVVRIVYTEKCPSRSEAQKREHEIKGYKKEQKMALISS